MFVRISSHVVVSLTTAALLSACGGQAPVATQTVTGHYDENPGADGGASPAPGGGVSQGPNAEKGTANNQTLLDAVIKQGVPQILAETSFKKYDQFVSRVRNSNYIVMIDFTKHSGKKRFFVVNVATGKVESTVVAHGSGSDPDNTGYAKFFSNTSGSLMSSLGSYLISEIYVSEKFDRAIRLDGLESSNDAVRERAVVMHGSDYVEEGLAKQGRSWGCTALSWDWRDKVLKILPGGSFMYIYGIANKMTGKMLSSHLQRMTDLTMAVQGRRLSESEDAPFAGE